MVKKNKQTLISKEIQLPDKLIIAISEAMSEISDINNKIHMCCESYLLGLKPEGMKNWNLSPDGKKLIIQVESDDIKKSKS